MNLYRHAIGHVLRQHRQNKGKTLRDVTKHTGVALGYLSEVERGIKEPSSEIIAAIAAGLDVPVFQLVREASEVMEYIELVQSGVSVDKVPTFA